MGGITSTYGNCCFYSSNPSKPVANIPPVPVNFFESMHQDLMLSPVVKRKLTFTHNLAVDILEAYSAFLGYIAEDFTLGYEELVKQYGCRVYGKETQQGLLFKVDWLTTVTGEEFISFFQDLNKRKSWDNSIEDFYRLNSNAEFVYEYALLKKKFAICQRDLLVVSKVFRSNGVYLVSISADHPLVPIVKNLVRINIKLAGYHAVSIPKDSFGNITRVFAVIEADFGGSVPKSILKKIIARAFPKQVFDLDQYINSHN